MLDVQKIRKQITERFPDVQVVRDAVVRTEDQGEKRTFAIYYFDYENVIWKQQIDLKEYQDSLLSKDYYTHSGDLQWNFYLVFIVSDDAYTMLTSTVKEAVEKDKIYSRKFVLKESELQEFLNFPGVSDSATHGDADPSLRWRDRLDNAGLMGVYSRQSKPEVIDSILEGDTRHENSIPLPHDGSADYVGHISELSIDSYRPYPAGRHYRFGRVNLIKGANGSGKTSLLEAIELCLCGNTLRNKDGDEHKSYKLSLTFKGRSETFEFDPSNTRLFKNRDLTWYGRPSSVQGRSSLHLSFNRYNFYNTDFAYQLANDKSMANLNNAFTALALGDEANYIDKRLRDFDEELRRQLKGLRKDEADIQNRLGLSESKLRKVLQVETRSSVLLRDALITIANEGLVVSANDVEAYKDSVHNDLVKAKDALKAIVDSIDWVSPLTFDSIALERTRAQDAQTYLRDSEDKRKKGIFEAKMIDDELAIVEKKARTLRQARLFFERPESLSLIGRQDYTEGLASKIASLRAKRENLEGILFDAIFGQFAEASTIDDACKSNLEAIDQVKTALLKLTSEADDERRVLGEAEALVSEIKSLGTRFVVVSHRVSSCPLCEAVYGNADELRRRIVSPPSLIVDDSNLKRKIFEISTKDSERKFLEDLHRQLEILRRFAKEMMQLNDGGITLAEIRAMVGALGVELANVESEWAKLDSDTKELARLGLTEPLLLQLAADFRSVGITLNFSEESGPAFAEALGRSENEFEELSRKKKVLSDRLLKLKSAVDGVLEGIFYSGIPANPDIELERRLVVLDRAEKSFRAAVKLVGIKGSDDLYYKKGAFERIVAHGEDLLVQQSREIREEVERKGASLEVEDAKKELVAVRARKERVEAASNVISDILQNDSKEIALRKFLDSYLSLITKTFRRIHAPREFVAIDPDKLRLFRENGEEASLSSISTGQRSAFALSIFFALNTSLVFGPPILMIDDPVAYVDDLNTLSFLDYLRDMAIHGERQIFFATANDKLANLFEKKFAFMEDEFKIMKFART